MTARRLGTHLQEVDDQTVGDVFWIRDMHVCSLVDVFMRSVSRPEKIGRKSRQLLSLNGRHSLEGNSM